MNGPTLATLEPQDIFVASTIRTTNDAESSPNGLMGDYWHAFFAQNGGCLEKESVIFGVYSNYELPFNVMTSKYDFHCGIKDPKSHDCPLKAFTIPKQDYLVFKGTGDMPHALIKTWQEIWAYFALPQKNQRAFGIDFELHNPAKPNEVDIYISVK